MAYGISGLRLAAFAAVLALGACQSGGGGSFSSLGGSPAGVPIALEVVDGPPAPVRSALADEMMNAASRRQVEIASSAAPARYRVRGYLSTETDAQGAPALAYVWDVFDTEKRRAKRVTGVKPIRTAGQDPWSGLDKDTLARLAAESMDEIAVFLSESKRVTAEAPAGSGATLAQ